MRWFWSFIALLCVITGGLYAHRVQDERAQSVQADAEPDQAQMTRRPRRSDRTTETVDEGADPSPNASAEPEPAAADTLDLQAAQPADLDSIANEPEVIATEEAQPEETTENAPKSTFDPGSLITTMNELRDQLPQELHARNQKPSTELKPVRREPETQAEPATTPEPETEIAVETKPAPQPEPAAPSFEQRPDGSFRIIKANVWVQGAGTKAEPFVLGWDALKALENSYDPKSGKDTLPDWLDLLEGKTVLIEGNSLLPVVASSTNELLIMQNPWDGCCIGVPPTPYDAVEVTLNHEVDFGNSVVGFGSVLGTFFIDPYVVDGWVLGLYIIEEGEYRSGAGVEFPEF